MNESRNLERVKREQRERTIELYQNIHKYPCSVFVKLMDEIRWYNKYIRYLEDHNER
jgi:hypothetical protein